MTEFPDGRRIAVVSDGSAHDLRAEAALIGDLTAVPVEPRVIVGDLAAGIRALPADVAAVFLTHVEPPRARRVQRELRESGARPVLIREDARAMVLAAAVLGSLRHGGRVVLAGAADLPLLVTLLMAAGVADITTWNPADEAVYPLRNIAYGADVVVDLAGAMPAGAASVVTAAAVEAVPVAAAAMVLAAVRVPELEFEIEVQLAAVRGLTAAGSLGAASVRFVADAVTGVFAPRPPSQRRRR